MSIHGRLEADDKWTQMNGESSSVGWWRGALFPQGEFWRSSGLNPCKIKQNKWINLQQFMYKGSQHFYELESLFKIFTVDTIQ